MMLDRHVDEPAVRVTVVGFTLPIRRRRDLRSGSDGNDDRVEQLGVYRSRTWFRPGSSPPRLLLVVGYLR
jgi:hypothetical protein